MYRRLHTPDIHYCLFRKPPLPSRSHGPVEGREGKEHVRERIVGETAVADSLHLIAALHWGFSRQKALSTSRSTLSMCTQRVYTWGHRVGDSLNVSLQVTGRVARNRSARYGVRSACCSKLLSASRSDVLSARSVCTHRVAHRRDACFTRYF